MSVDKLKLQPGDLVSIVADVGPYGVAKILAADEGGVHIRVYVQRYAARPTTIDPAGLTLSDFLLTQTGPLSVGHLPLSHGTFAHWQPEHIAGGSVGEHELEGYRNWVDAEGGYF